MLSYQHLSPVLLIAFLLTSCSGLDGKPQKTAIALPDPPPSGILLEELPPGADLIISSIRHVITQPACRGDDGKLQENFILDRECSQLIYDQQGGLAASRQLFALDIDSGEVDQLTNTDCLYLSGQALDERTLMVDAICEDTNSDGVISDGDDPQLYLLDLSSGEMDCLTCGLGLKAINNPDFSPIQDKIVFSAQIDPVFHNYLFTVDLNRQLQQLTREEEFMDFDCAWSEDGTLIVFNRLPAPWLERPSQVWLMSADGSRLTKLTAGGSNPRAEGPQRGFPIGTDADPDLSPDNSQVVFSRLRTGAENAPFGIWELVVLGIATGVETVLDSSYANMVPEWKEGGIVFTRQIGGSDPMEIVQALYLYQEGSFLALESYPYNVFPLGAFGGSWIRHKGSAK
jgi:Tol biopolymer transport system component